MRIQRRVFVAGKVQGVSFRAGTMAEVRARGGDIQGYVRNLPDGRVEAVFQGEEPAVLALVSWCRSGPPGAQVDALEVIEEDVGGNLGSFRILR